MMFIEAYEDHIWMREKAKNAAPFITGAARN